MKIRKAVIPAAGLGTRFLPATKVLPKELIPVVDRPGIQWAVEEAARAGIEDVLFISSRGKSLLEDHFDRAPELEERLAAKGKQDELDTVRAISDLVRVHSVRQMEPLGFGHAVLQARDHIGDEAFVVMVPDEVVPAPEGNEQPLLERMISAHEEHGQSIVAVKEVPREDVSSYGVVDPEFITDDLARIKRFVEKPPVEEAPSNLASVGRYVLTPTIFGELSRTKPGVGNEIQLTDGIQAVVEKEGGLAYVHSGPIYDVGRKYDYIKATIELALRRDDLQKPLTQLIADIAARA